MIRIAPYWEFSCNKKKKEPFHYYGAMGTVNRYESYFPVTFVMERRRNGARYEREGDTYIHTYRCRNGLGRPASRSPPPFTFGVFEEEVVWDLSGVEDGSANTSPFDGFIFCFHFFSSLVVGGASVEHWEVSSSSSIRGSGEGDAPILKHNNNNNGNKEQEGRVDSIIRPLNQTNNTTQHNTPKM
eukprot:gene1392-815_t